MVYYFAFFYTVVFWKTGNYNSIVCYGACAKISVSLIARHVNLARRSLERRFTRLVGKTPHQIIAEERLRRARQLLIDTDFTLEQIAAMSGFSSAAYLSVIIKQHENCTPTEFRLKSQH